MRMGLQTLGRVSTKRRVIVQLQKMLVRRFGYETPGTQVLLT